MQFQPKSEKEVSEARLAPEGEYDFEVLESEDAVSKKTGNPMIKVKLGLYRGDAIANHVYDYLMPAMEAKLRHFCDTTGMLAQYESGQLNAEHFKGRSGRAKILKKEAEGNFQAKNEVKDYVCRKAKPLGQSAEPQTPQDDDVPF